MSDNSLLSAGPNSVVSLDRFAFDASTNQGQFDTSLRKGSLSIVSGRIAKQSPDAMTVRTPSAILGVRGTEFAQSVSTTDPRIARRLLRASRRFRWCLLGACAHRETIVLLAGERWSHHRRSSSSSDWPRSGARSAVRRRAADTRSACVPVYIDTGGGRVEILDAALAAQPARRARRSRCYFVEGKDELTEESKRDRRRCLR